MVGDGEFKVLEEDALLTDVGLLQHEQTESLVIVVDEGILHQVSILIGEFVVVDILVEHLQVFNEEGTLVFNGPGQELRDGIEVVRGDEQTPKLNKWNGLDVNYSLYQSGQNGDVLFLLILCNEEGNPVKI